jgi:hypothetical protein
MKPRPVSRLLLSEDILHIAGIFVYLPPKWAANTNACHPQGSDLTLSSTMLQCFHLPWLSIKTFRNRKTDTL